jgi:short-subunit dehydrogenase
LSWKLEGGVAVITGAGSGIGRALAQRLAAEKMSLVIADVNEKGLAETAGSVAQTGVSLSTHIVDVGDAARVEAFATEVVTKHGRATLLINNAGIAMHGNFDELSLADLQMVMQTNFWGVVNGVRAFLPILRRQTRAHIVNLSSIFGIVSPPGETAYCASKFAVRGFTECLEHELEGSSVGVSCVHPGAIRTAIARSAPLGAGARPAVREMNVSRFERLPQLPPEAAAERIVVGVKRGERRILIGKDAIRLDRLQRLFPLRYWNIMRAHAEKMAARETAPRTT